MGRDIAELIERLKAAQGPDRELDRHLHGEPLGTTRWSFIPNYTASIDAALALTERELPGWACMISENWDHLRGISGERMAFVVELRPVRVDGRLNDEDTFSHVVYGATRPLAILAALLSALEAERQTP